MVFSVAVGKVVNFQICCSMKMLNEGETFISTYRTFAPHTVSAPFKNNQLVNKQLNNAVLQDFLGLT